jgi:hypothetical protein
MSSHPLIVKPVTDEDTLIISTKIMTIPDLGTDSGIFKVKDLESKDKFQVVIRMFNEGEVSCNCKYHWSFNLYCAHIFAVFNVL